MFFAHVEALVAAACGVVSAPLPPHFPDPNANPIDLLEQALRDKDEIIADQHRELTAWRTQLEAALAKLASLENREFPK